jgi:hypothetical protein
MMKSCVALIGILLAFLTGAAQAEIVYSGGKHRSNLPTIIRGSALNCDARSPVIINVQDALKTGRRTTSNCIVKVRTSKRHRPYSITNIVVILAPTHKHHYIKSY